MLRLTAARTPRAVLWLLSGLPLKAVRGDLRLPRHQLAACPSHRVLRIPALPREGPQNARAAALYEARGQIGELSMEIEL